MDFQKEFEDLKKVWSERTTAGKVILIFAFGLSAMSVGSIADTVFEFKGFIVHGIKFYREITEPIRLFFKSYFNINVHQQVQDVAILIVLQLRAVYKFLNIRTNVERKEGIALFFGTLTYDLILLSIVIVLYVNSILMIGLLCATPFLPIIFGYSVNKDRVVAKSDIAESLYIISIYLLVAIIAAISEGLARPIV